ncbi:MAG: hypothetical protein WCO02_15665 [Bacteroidota bacterium]
MRKLSLIILAMPVFLLMALQLMADSPHGKDFKLSCDLCHSSSSWKFDKTIYAFDHNKTTLPLSGRHLALNCRQCHTSLVFSEAKSACVDCHTDMHNQTVGPDCQRCHSSRSWIIENITEIHQKSRFPLVGPHYTAQCAQCHPSASLLRFEPQGVECYDCHAKDYASTTKPNHVQANYSKNCTECHSITSFTWTNANINHDFFPLTLGHSGVACADCHVNGTSVKPSRECVSCHINNYNSTTNPNHITTQFPTSCTDCHTTNPGWKPASYTSHDAQFFPIYSGKHQGTWTACSDCHTNAASLKTFSCIDCHDHNQPKTDQEHNGIGGYTYASIPCYECHPTGSKQGSFNHNNGKFPLTGAHITTPCTQCHVNGFQGTPTDCFACHAQAYNQTTNPNHTTAHIPTSCADCHTTVAGWKPASFAMHDAQYFPVYSGKHAGTWQSCAECHTTPNNYGAFSCIDCHAHAKPVTDQGHNGVGGYVYASLYCYQCHPTGSVQGSFNHNNGIFPLTGAHTTTPCSSCHANGFVGTPTDCSACHTPNYTQSTNPNHVALNIPNTCATCHSTAAGWKPASFPIHNSYYPLTGKHATIANNCVQCHNGNYINPPNTCVGCHLANYNNTTNPNHASISIPTTCADCHTTNPGWTPATFPIHNNYYVLAGAHITRPCTDCHTGNYTSAPTTCIGCHQTNYNQTTNPNHAAAQFPTDCLTCHTQVAWSPSTFNHDGQYFPIYSGHHKNRWTLCSDCHPNVSNFQEFTCTTSCHPQNSTNNNHQGVSGYSYNSNACYQCHPTGSSGGKLIKVPNNFMRKE